MVTLKDIRFQESHEELIEGERFLITRQLVDIGDYGEGDHAWERELELHKLFDLLSLHHFGVPPTIQQQEVVDLGCRLSREFFAGDWWKAHRNDVKHLTRQEGNEDLEWLEPLQLALLFAGLKPDKRLLKVLGKWPASWMEAEWRAVPFPDGLEQLYFRMITQCGLGDIESDGGKIKDKRVGLLFDALEDPTDEGLTAALNASLRLFVNKLKRKQKTQKPLPYQAIALEETILVLLWRAMKKTDLLPQIKPDLQPHVLQLVPKDP